MMAYQYPYGNPYGTQNFYPYQQNPGFSQPASLVQTQQAAQDDRIWVASESAAEAFQMVPNGFVRLWDSNKQIFYEKRADMNGRPMPLVAYEYKIRDASAGSESVTAGFEQRLSAVEEKLKHMMEGQKNDA